jgi:hypothetical protein
MRRALIGVGVMALLALAFAGPQAPAATVTPQITWRGFGGFAAVDNRLVISAGGRAVLTMRSQPRPAGHTYRRTLSRARHQRLLRLVRAAHIERLPRRYSPATPVADGISESLTFRGRTVTVEQESNPPKALQRALDALARLQLEISPG